jgi:O-glycosyl hydrolase
MNRLTISSVSETGWDVEIQVDTPLQTIDGFGACFNELGWTSLSALNDDDKEAIFRQLFAPGVGANFSICRMPVGANDFSLDWHSYDEVPGDFALEHFGILNDLKTLVPFIRKRAKISAKAEALGLALEPADVDEITISTTRGRCLDRACRPMG